MRYFVFTLPFLLFASSGALACSPPPRTESASFYAKEAFAVFVGTVKKVEVVKDSKSGAEELEFSFSVEAAWKGVKENEVIVRSVKPDGMCHGAHFEAGQRYLVFAGANPGASMLRLDSSIGPTRILVGRPEETEFSKTLGDPIFKPN